MKASAELVPASRDSRPTVATPDDDPYLWLEDIDGQNALAWVEAENKCTPSALVTAPFEANCDALVATFGRRRRRPLVPRRS
jgi:prolyl oligopeptidase